MADSQHLSLLVFDSFCDGPVEWLLVMPDLYVSYVEAHSDPVMVFNSQTALYLQNRIHGSIAQSCVMTFVGSQISIHLVENPLF